MKYRDGSVFKGDWRSDERRDGVAEMKYGDGARYEGNYKDGNKSGQG